MGAMTVDEIYKDRKKFSNKVFDIASTDLFNMGIQVRNISRPQQKIPNEYNIAWQCAISKKKSGFQYLSFVFFPFFQVISYTLKDIKDEDEYMVSLGMARTSEIQRDARIGEAEANRDAQIETAVAEEQRLAAKLINQTEVERWEQCTWR